VARGRMISKAISLDEKVDSLSDDTARLLFTWMIPHLDCEGRIYGEAKVFRSIVAPRRNYSIKKVEKILTELKKTGLIERYSINGNTYISVPNFQKHQTGLRKDKESQSQIPANTADKRRSEDGLTPPQVKVKVKDKEEDKEEGSSSPSKQNVLDCYERNLGSASEDMEREIELATNIYSASWVIDAIQESVKQNHRAWTYVAGILNNWKRFGKNKNPPRNKGSPDPDKYIKGKFGHRVQR